LLIEREELAAEAPARAVRFEALGVDPRGVPMVYDWQFCPVESSETCSDYEQRKSAIAPAVASVFVPILDAAHAQASRGAAVLSPAGAVVTGGFDVQIAPQLFGYHLQSSALGLGNGVWASAVLKLEAGPETLLAQKRVVLNARDLSAFNPELAAAGWQVCDPTAPAASGGGCLPLRPRTANRNPEIVGFEIARGDDVTFVPGVSPLLLTSKEKVRLRPLLGAEAEEPYQTIESTLQGNQLVVVDHREELVVSWFTTAGTFEDEQTALQLNRSLDNSFTAPEVIPGGAGKVTVLFLVVRDQRGGVGWARIDAQVP
jgi:hypothetical protein